MDEKSKSLELSKIKTAIRSGIPLSITTYTLPHDMEMYMTEVLSLFLKELNQEFMISYLTYCLQELITNAKKANTKRVYFKEKGLDINNEDDYNRGMESFKKDTLNNISYYLQKQKAQGLYVRLLLQFKNDKIKIEVRNNSIITVYEYKRIHDKLNRVQQYTSIEEAISSVLDDSEGAGLGIIILVLMLKKIGMTEENFQTVCENGETVTRIILPLSEEMNRNIDIVSEEFEKNINELPQFPENITRLNQLLSNPDSTMTEIAAQISNDVALTGELLKQVNSAAYALNKQCVSISEAVKMMGIRGIRNILFTIGTMDAFAKIGADTEQLWSHSYRVAFYSYNLARNFCTGERRIIEDAYVCGLMHDMGKIIFETAHPDFFDNVKGICEQKGVKTELFEKVLAGINHSEVGARIAKKWNFPQTITDVIRYHHIPEEAPKETSKLACIVYLADLMTHNQEMEVDYYQIDSSILGMFKITSERQFQKIGEKLKEAFDNN